MSSNTTNAKPVGHFVNIDDRTLAQMRAAAPKHPRRRFVQWNRGCDYCGRRARRKAIAVNPITLQRMFHLLCRRSKCSQALKAWEGMASARLRRAQFDWEREHPTVAARQLVGYIPPQYPSLSRATLRAFIDSGEIAATIEDSNDAEASALNGTIRALGFAGQVYAEIRSGQTVLRRTPEHSQ